MKEIVADVTSERTAHQISAQLVDASDCDEPTRLILRVLAPRGARKWVAKLFTGKSGAPSRAERGSALVARGYQEITAQSDAAGDDVVTGHS